MRCRAAGSIADVWIQEQAALMPLPCAFDGFVEHSKRVPPTCLINFERNRYSVPASFANRPVSLRVYPERLVIVAEGQFLCEHPRYIDRSHKHLPRITYDWRHYLAVIQRKPGALRNGAPFTELPPAFRQLQDIMLRRPPSRACLHALPGSGRRSRASWRCKHRLPANGWSISWPLVLHHDEQDVLAAVEMALTEGVATKSHVLNLLHRLVDGKVTGGPDIDTPQALILRLEPKANVERYDGLRAQTVGGRHAS